MEYISIKQRKEKNITFIKTKINNKKYIKKQMIKKLFDNINGYCLDKYQRTAIIQDEENSLILAGAGSGKTLTIVGKVRYLIEMCNIDKDEILCISFTNDSVDNLKNALLKNYNYDVEVYTFHKLSLKLIKSVYNNISIVDSNLLEYIIDEFFYCNLKNQKLLKTSSYTKLKKLISTFINLFKSNNYDVNLFNSIFKNLKYSSEYILLKIINEIYIQYELELKSTCKIDFNDMINMATDIVKTRYIKQYKYIIIDEYQDTSITKYELIRQIKIKTNAKLFVVGDDFQSIYRFTGCNLSIFLKFNKLYDYSKIFKIKNTYRNSIELIKVTNKFITKNKNQIKKDLKSNKSITYPIVIIYTKNIRKAFIKLIENINTSILVLGRNNNDIYKVIDDDFKFINKSNIIYKNKKFRYMTIHRSKGLEDENIIIINMEDSETGFPSKIENNKILNYVLDVKDSYLYEEERRLFYVALTRTKNRVYLIVDKDHESIFIKEIIKDSKQYIKIINI